jgi:mannosyltransferase
VEVSRTVERPVKRFGVFEGPPGGLRFISNRATCAIYVLCLAVSISIWFFAITKPLWLDETVSFFVIKGGFGEILFRQGWPGVPAYPYILCLWAKLVGTGEIALRISSVLAMLGAAYALYLCARELFEWDVAIVAAVIFCLDPVVILESIDIRPYAFAALAITLSILALIRLRRSNSLFLAAALGFSAASIAYFQFLFVVILPAMAICLFALTVRPARTSWRQLGIALLAFCLGFLPVIPGLQYMFHTSGIHNFDAAPTLMELGSTLALGGMGFILVAILIVAVASRRLDLQGYADSWVILLCISLALVPLLILYGVSAATPVHLFVFRYRIVAVPGIALCWALLLSRIDSRFLRLLFCAVIVAATAYHTYISPSYRRHYSWKYALEFVENNASVDGAPVLICSDLPESNYMAMPSGPAVKDSAIFAPLTYYQLSVPVVPLPRSLNDEAIQAGSQFLQQAAARHERFLALAFVESYATLDWLRQQAATTDDVRDLGVLDGVKVLEFVPREVHR